MKAYYLRAFCAPMALACAMLANDAAVAQLDIGQTQIPLNDANCDFSPFSTPNITVPPCSVDGTRTVTLQSVSRAPFDPNPSLDRVTSTFHVDFDGNLQVDGLPVITGPGGMPPFFGDAANYFSTSATTVNLQSSYDGDMFAVVPNGAPAPNQNANWAYLFNTRNFQNNVRSIDVDLSGTVDAADGGEYDFGLASIDPTAITGGNSVALSGTFNGQSGTGRSEEHTSELQSH